MIPPPRMVFGMPAYNRPDTVAETLESLLGQTYTSLAVIIVDDAPSAQVQRILMPYLDADPRVTYEANPVRRGMVGNWRKAFARSRKVYPHSEYFAWASDHDIWHPRWLEVLIRELEDHPEVVLAYPQMMRVYAASRRRMMNVVDTRGVASPRERMRRAVGAITAGNCIYGLFRAKALAQAGVFRPVIMPDRQVLVELSLFGEFSQVPELLWYREVAGTFSFERQRRMFFRDGVPVHTFLPANVQHFLVLLLDLCLRGRGLPDIGRASGAGYAVLQLWFSVHRELLRDDARWRVSLGRTAFGRTLLGWFTRRDDPGSAELAPEPPS